MSRASGGRGLGLGETGEIGQRLDLGTRDALGTVLVVERVGVRRVESASRDQPVHLVAGDPQHPRRLCDCQVAVQVVHLDSIITHRAHSRNNPETLLDLAGRVWYTRDSRGDRT